MAGRTTARGLGWQHQKQVARLKQRHIDGTPCWWCGNPTYLNPERNPDRRTLHGDHSTSRDHGGNKADRLMHGKCNEERGNGDRDHQRPALKRAHGGHHANLMAWDGA